MCSAIGDVEPGPIVENRLWVSAPFPGRAVDTRLAAHHVSNAISFMMCHANHDHTGPRCRIRVAQGSAPAQPAFQASAEQRNPCRAAKHEAACRSLQAADLQHGIAERGSRQGLLYHCRVGGLRDHRLIGAADDPPDAHLAALAIEHGATVLSFDRDFARFEGVQWTLPVAN